MEAVVRLSGFSIDSVRFAMFFVLTHILVEVEARESVLGGSDASWVGGGLFSSVVCFFLLGVSKDRPRGKRCLMHECCIRGFVFETERAE